MVQLLPIPKDTKELPLEKNQYLLPWTRISEKEDQENRSETLLKEVKENLDNWHYGQIQLIGLYG